MSSLGDQIRGVIARDKLGNGSVSAATVAELELMLAEPGPDSDVLAERAACLALLRQHRDRLLELAVNNGAIALEARRIGEAIYSAEHGLHRNLKSGG